MRLKRFFGFPRPERFPHSLKILYTDQSCEYEIMQKRYRIPGEIFACIVNDPCLLCFTCRKSRQKMSLDE
ncbi:hypothetical protein PUN28_004820 [Cardiocondyla obscurior]|uniref:Uncharacterized protein n=1 Tax=Cardiocondyla obscurior TaxID=286306 RepID=A0AAW2GEK8_9HYME